MKNKLPGIVTPNFFDGNANEQGNAINQIITYIIELTEVVEGKQETKHYASLPDLAPSLKETLMGELLELPLNYSSRDGQGLVVRSEVEAIINRLMR